MKWHNTMGCKELSTFKVRGNMLGGLWRRDDKTDEFDTFYTRDPIGEADVDMIAKFADWIMECVEYMRKVKATAPESVSL